MENTSQKGLMYYKLGLGDSTILLSIPDYHDNDIQLTIVTVIFRGDQKPSSPKHQLKFSEQFISRTFAHNQPPLLS